MPSWVLQVALTVVLAIVAWALKRAIAKIDDHTKELVGIRLELATDYVKRGNLADLRREMRRTTAFLNRVTVYLAVIATKLNVKLPEMPEVVEEHDET